MLRARTLEMDSQHHPILLCCQHCERPIPSQNNSKIEASDFSPTAELNGSQCSGPEDEVSYFPRIRERNAPISTPGHWETQANKHFSNPMVSTELELECSWKPEVVPRLGQSSTFNMVDARYPTGSTKVII